MRRARPRAPGLLATCALAALTSAAAPAAAWVQARNMNDKPHIWRTRCVELQVLTGDPPPYLDSATVLHAAAEAARAWAPGVLGCGDILLAPRGNIAASRPVAPDRINTVQFYRTTWPNDPRALAITQVFSQTATGVVVDADVEINAVHFTWADLVRTTMRPATSTADLQNTLTHEFGHVLGLDHNCNAPGQPELIEASGQRAPECSVADARVRDATMFPAVDLTDTLRRDLAADDVAAVCTLYAPNRQDDATSRLLPDGRRICEAAKASSGGGCVLAGSGAAGGAARVPAPAVALLASVLALGARRARRRGG